MAMQQKLSFSYGVIDIVKHRGNGNWAVIDTDSGEKLIVGDVILTDGEKDELRSRLEVCFRDWQMKREVKQFMTEILPD